MPISTTVATIIVLVMVLVSLIGIGLILYYLSDLFFFFYFRKKLYCALENTLVSYSKSQDFENTMAELESIIQHIIKPNKDFSTSCYSISGLLKQYVYWLNIGRIHPKVDITELKSISHHLVDEYYAKSFTSEIQLYEEPLLNEVSKSLAKKDFEGIQNSLALLDAKIAKERKKSKTIYIWLPPVATIIGTIIAAIISSLLQ